MNMLPYKHIKSFEDIKIGELYYIGNTIYTIENENLEKFFTGFNIKPHSYLIFNKKKDYVIKDINNKFDKISILYKKNIFEVDFQQYSFYEIDKETMRSMW